MKIHPTVKSAMQQTVVFAGRAINAVLQASAGAIATVAAAQVFNRLGDDSLDRVIHQDAIALDNKDNLPYVPAALLLGSYALSRIGTGVQNLTSLVDRTEPVSTQGKGRKGPKGQ